MLSLFLKHILAFILISIFTVNTSYANLDAKRIASTYADIGFAIYDDSLQEAIKLRREIRKLISKPSQEQLLKARTAWKRARIPYSQSEVFRFGNPIVDEWEGKVNAWPLDEGLIDYVVNSRLSADNHFSTANVIANEELVDGDISINALKINQELLEVLHSVGDIETNVATGYHAIEFLLWGQDLNGTGKGSGNRPYTDFDRKKCSNGNCFRRGAYLKAAANLLVKELTWMTKQWDVYTDEKYSYIEGSDFDVFSVGTLRKTLEDMSEPEVLAVIIVGMGSLAYGELAGERTKLALILNDPEEEQDCFSDNTHNSHYYNLKGIRNIFYGKYQRIDGSIVSGLSIADSLNKADGSVFVTVEKGFNSSLEKATALVNSAVNNEVYFDQLIAKSNADGEKLLNDFIESLLELTESFNRMASALDINGVTFEGSDAFLDSGESDFFR